MGLVGKKQRMGLEFSYSPAAKFLLSFVMKPKDDGLAGTGLIRHESAK